MDVYELLDNAPEYAEDVASLYDWSTNYDTGNGPFSLFLDMIGWSDDELGTVIYGPTIHWAEQAARNLTSWNANLGYVELSKLADALKEYVYRPQDVRAYVDQLMTAESED